MSQISVQRTAIEPDTSRTRGNRFAYAATQGIDHLVLLKNAIQMN